MVLAVGQIILREVFGTGYIWLDPLIKLMVLWLAMVGSVAACRDDRHIRIDALSHILPDSVAKTTRIVVDLFAALVCGFIAWHTYRYLRLEIEFDDRLLLDVPAWWIHIIVPLAFLLTGYRFLVLVAQQIFTWADGEEPEKTE